MLGVGYNAGCDAVAPTKAHGLLDAGTETPPTRIVAVLVEIVNVIVELSLPSLEVVGNSVTMLDSEGRGLELVDLPFGVLEGGRLGPRVTVVVEVSVVMLVVGGELDLKVGGGPIGNVVFRAGHLEDPVSRRTGH